jgi:RNase P/RNase MRP subunit POP5
MKALKPSLRENKRYLLVAGNNLKKTIPQAILEFSGTLGFSKCGLSFIKTQERDKQIICINRESLNLVRASLCVYKEKIIVEQVSGTLKKLNSKI